MCAFFVIFACISLTATAQSTVTTLAGVSGATGFADGPAASSTFYFPEGVACTPAGAVYVADTANGRLRAVNVGVVSTPNVTDSAGAPLPLPFTPSITAIALDAAGAIFLSTGTTHRILALTPSYQLSVLAGKGSAGFSDNTGAAAAFDAPAGLATVSDAVYVADSNNNCIRAVSKALGVVTTIAGGGPGNVGSANGVGMSASFNKPRGVAALGNALYVADTGNSLIRSVSLADQTVATLVGSGSCAFADGLGAAASLCAPKGIAADASGGVLYVSDTLNYRVRRVVAASGETTTLAGGASAGAANGAGTAAAFNQPGGLCAAPDGAVVVADRLSSLIRVIAVGTPTPTPSSSPSRTASGTLSPTATGSPSPTASPTSSVTGSGTQSPTATGSPSPTASPQVCTPGSFLPPGAAACATCPRGSVQPNWGAPSACATCTGALRANPNATRCNPCERMTRPDPSTPSCAPCRAGEFCDGNATDPLPCTPTDACLAYGASAPCKDGYEGAACARCVKRFFRASSGECVSCDTVNVIEWLGVTSPLWLFVCGGIVASFFMAQQHIALHEQVMNAFGAYPQFLSTFFAHVARLVLLYRLSALPFPSTFTRFLSSVGQLGFSWESIAACRQEGWGFYSTWNLVVIAFAVFAVAILVCDIIIAAGKWPGIKMAAGSVVSSNPPVLPPVSYVFPFRSWRVVQFVDIFFPSYLQLCFMAFAIAPNGKFLFYDPATPPRFEYFIFSALGIAIATTFVLLRSCCVLTRLETRAFRRNGGGARCAPRGGKYETRWTTRIRVSRLLSSITRICSFFLAATPLVASNLGPEASVRWIFACIGTCLFLSILAAGSSFLWGKREMTPKRGQAICCADMLPMCVLCHFTFLLPQTYTHQYSRPPCRLIDSIIFFVTIGSLGCLWGPAPAKECNATKSNNALGDALIAINVSWAILLLLIPVVMWSAFGACCHHSVGSVCSTHEEVLILEGGFCHECSNKNSPSVDTPTAVDYIRHRENEVYYPSCCKFFTLELEESRKGHRAGCCDLQKDN
jgi:sugar lactone lactonase YvrE